MHSKLRYIHRSDPPSLFTFSALCQNDTGILKTLSTLEASRKFGAVDMDMGFSLEHVQMIEVFLEHTFVIKLSGGRW